MIVQVIVIHQKNMVARGRGLFSLYIYIENFKNLLVRNQWSDFLYNLAGMFLWSPSAKVVRRHNSSKKYGCKGAGLIFLIYLFKKLEKISCQTPLDRFQYNLAEMFPW